jgi:hypothetical protein
VIPFGLVSIPAALYAAERVIHRMVAREAGIEAKGRRTA